MFDNLLKTLDQLSKTTEISIPLAADSKGYLDRECPNEDCLFHFKVNEEDWGRIQDDAGVTCPMCGHKAHRKSWYTTQHVQQAKERAIGSLQGAINKAMRDDARSFNSRQPRTGLIKMSMRVTGSGAAVPDISVPIEAAEAMEMEIHCEQCSTKFAVVGAAFFCPTCGHNSAERMFDDSLRKIKVKMSSVAIVRDAIEGASGKDAAVVAARSMLESCLPDGVMAFQKHWLSGKSCGTAREWRARHQPFTQSRSCASMLKFLKVESPTLPFAVASKQTVSPTSVSPAG